MVTRQGGVKLLDFGVAKAAEHIRDERTRTGTLKGKVNYLSPEAAEGLPADQRTDIFALGIVLHESLTLRRLFKADGDLQTLRMIREAKVAPPSALRPEVSPELDRVVLKMLARDPAERYQSCGALLADLEPIASALGGDAAGLAALVADLRIEPAAPQPVEDMESGPTPVVEVENLIKAGETGKVQRSARPRWLPAVLAAAVVVPALGVALVAARWSSMPPALVIAAPPPPALAPPKPEPGFLVVQTDNPQARISLDGQVVADRAIRARIPVERAGEHELLITAPRRKPLQRKITVAAGATVQLDVKLEKSHAGAKPKRGENYLVNPFAK